MEQKQQNFQTIGSNALKAAPSFTQHEIDVFAKPQYMQVVPLNVIKFESPSTQINSTQIFEDPYFEFEVVTPGKRSKALLVKNAICTWALKGLDALKKNRILGDLFIQHPSNTYRKSDVLFFAKGFTITGLATFLLVLFGS